MLQYYGLGSTGFRISNGAFLRRNRLLPDLKVPTQRGDDIKIKV